MEDSSAEQKQKEINDHDNNNSFQKEEQKEKYYNPSILESTLDYKDIDILQFENNEYNRIDLSFKIIVIGNSGVGKSSLVERATKNRFLELVKMMEDNTLTSKNLKDILQEILESKQTIKEIIKEKGIENITDDNEIRKIIKKVINDNSESVEDYKNGHDRAIKFLMGQVMKETKGKANPKLAMDILKEELK